MGEIKQPKPEKLVIAVIYKDEDVYEKATKDLIAEYGNIDFESPVIKFESTLYYKDELGPDLSRRFISFKKLVDPGLLADIPMTLKRSILSRELKKGVLTLIRACWQRESMFWQLLRIMPIEYI